MDNLKKGRKGKEKGPSEPASKRYCPHIQSTLVLTIPDARYSDKIRRPGF